MFKYYTTSKSLNIFISPLSKFIIKNKDFQDLSLFILIITQLY
jgi:hypothetical protein